jgi:CBS domain-containing protein
MRRRIVAAADAKAASRARRRLRLRASGLLLLSVGGLIMRLADIMTTRVERVGLNETPAKARTLMRLRRIHHLVVVDDHTVKGLLTDEDLRGPAADASPTVAPLMTAHVATAPSDLTVRKAANLLRGSNTGALPVLERGKLVGIVTVSDLLELLGRGEHPASNEKGKRWTLRDRGVRPPSTRPPSPRRGR